MGKLDQAIEQWSRTVEIHPEHADAQFNLGRAYTEKKMWAEALAPFQRAAALKPEHAAAQFNLGNVNFHLERKPQARDCFTRTVGLNPDYLQGWINLGLVELRNGDPEAAFAALEKALALDPENILAHFNRGQALLLVGRMKEGLAEVEWRRRVQNLPFPAAGKKPWQGGDIAGKKILLYGEQGQGDVIHFLRYAKVLAGRGAGTAVYCHPGLVGIAKSTEGVDDAAAFSDPPPAFETFAPLMSLPHLLGLPEIEDIPEAPYVTPPVSRSLISGTDRLRVGLVWKGNPDHDDDLNRSADLSDFRPLLDVEGSRFYSLQVGDPVGDIERQGLSNAVVDLGTGFENFTDTAAAIQALDLVISVDTAVPHLAGAMGKPVWLLLPRVPDWRWFLDGDETPWYPTMRLFRQTGEQDWRPVIERLAGELAGFSKDAG